MNAQRIPTQAENAAMVRRSRNHTIRQQRGLERYEQIQADAPEPVNFCAVPEEEGMTTTTLLISCLAGLALWALYAAGAVLAIDYFGAAGLIGSILGACAIVYAAARIGRFV